MLMDAQKQAEGLIAAARQNPHALLSTLALGLLVRGQAACHSGFVCLQISVSAHLCLSPSISQLPSPPSSHATHTQCLFLVYIAYHQVLASLIPSITVHTEEGEMQATVQARVSLTSYAPKHPTDLPCAHS